jgi:hypothetical protein
MARHQGYQPAPAPGPRQAAPVGPMASSGVKPAPIGAPLLPLATQTAAALGLAVVVRTPQRIGGQFEHAAMITRVHSPSRVNVLLMPDGEVPYPVPDIEYSEQPSITGINWRWPTAT